MEDLLRSLWEVLGGIFRGFPLTSQKLPLCGNQQTERMSGQLLRSLLQNPRNFSEVAPEVRLAVHTALLCLKNLNFCPREAREFLGRRRKNSNTAKTKKIPHLGSLPS